MPIPGALDLLNVCVLCVKLRILGGVGVANGFGNRKTAFHFRIALCIEDTLYD